MNPYGNNVIFIFLWNRILIKACNAFSKTVNLMSLMASCQLPLYVNNIQMMTTLMDPALKRIKMKKISEDFALTLTLDEEI